MNLKELKELRKKLTKLLLLNNNSKYKKFYLTLAEKRGLLQAGKKIPIRVQGNGRDRKLLVKTRGTIESGYLKNKRMGL